MEQIDILSLSPEALRAYLEAWGEPKFRAKQIFGWLHQKQVTEFSQMTSLSLQLREKLEQNFCINRLNIERRLASSIDDTVKYLYRLPDGMSVLRLHHCRIRAESDTGGDAAANLRDTAGRRLPDRQPCAHGNRGAAGQL